MKNEKMMMMGGPIVKVEGLKVDGWMCSGVVMMVMVFLIPGWRRIVFSGGDECCSCGVHDWWRL